MILFLFRYVHGCNRHFRHEVIIFIAQIRTIYPTKIPVLPFPFSNYSQCFDKLCFLSYPSYISIDTMTSIAELPLIDQDDVERAQSLLTNLMQASAAMREGKLPS